ncbi:MAG: acetate/propionate family kinase [Thermaerobacter sp.]|nr:acetate/propionate family kinase [Thermaerobacter sp.]
MPKGAVVLAVNSGSSSLKCSLYDAPGRPLRLLARGAVERVGLPRARMWLEVRDEPRWSRPGEFSDASAAVGALLAALQEQRLPAPTAVGHRFVSGGPLFRSHRLIDAAFRAALPRLVPFAPLHLPAQIRVLEAMTEHFPRLPQAACFDTAFHRGLPEEAARLPLPGALARQGIRRYGFHGLSFEYLTGRLGSDRRERVVLAHLGSGASLAALRDGKPRDTTMGLTPLGGLVMGTRPGDLDPGVLLYLLNTAGYDAAHLERTLDRESGLLGISGRTSDMRTLLERQGTDPAAALAVELFCRSVAKGVAAMAVSLAGLDVLVFAGGIGENAPAVRARVGELLSFLGLALDPQANARHAPLISSPASRVRVRVIPTDEDLIIARHTRRLALLTASGERAAWPGR